MMGFISLIAGSLLGFSSLRQTDEPAVREYIDRYTDENGISIEVLGVCDIEPNKLAAWDTKGARSQTLEDIVSKFLEKQQYPDLPFRFERKNRYVAIRHASPNGVSLSIQGADSTNQISQTQGYGLPDESISLIPAYASKGQKETSLFVTVPDGKVQILEFPLRNKQSKKLSSGECTLEKVKALRIEDIDGIDENYRVRYSMLMVNNKAWGIYFRLPSLQASQQSAFLLSPKNSKQILIVDVNGNPLALSYKDLKPVPYDPVFHVPADPKSFAIGASTVVLRPNSTSPIVATNINPANIRSIQVLMMATKRIALVHIPLDMDTK